MATKYEKDAQKMHRKTGNDIHNNFGTLREQCKWSMVAGKRVTFLQLTDEKGSLWLNIHTVSTHERKVKAKVY